MSAPVQLSLALRLPADMLVRARLAQQLWCEAQHASLARSLCIAYQIGDPTLPPNARMRLEARAPAFCRSGQCRQGVGVLLQEGVLERAQCPTCAGCGWVPRERPRAEGTGVVARVTAR